MEKTKVTMNINDFPEEIHHLLKDANIFDSSCHSNALVFYIDSGYYLKIDEKDALKKEVKLTQLFNKYGLGVELIAYLSNKKDYMVTRSASGKDATNYLDDPKRLCEVLAKILFELHSKSIHDSPISTRMIRYKECINHYDSCNFDESVLMNRFGIKSKEEAIQIIQKNKHKLRQDTLIHGDCCLPNIILNNDKFSSLIDFNMSGIGDKHIDLYWAIWSLNYNLKTDGLFFKSVWKKSF